MTDYYQVLELDRSHSADELQDDLFQLRKKWVSRQNSANPETQQKAKSIVALIDEAAEVFQNETSRKDYDRQLASGSSRASGAPASGTAARASGPSRASGGRSTSSAHYKKYQFAPDGNGGYSVTGDHIPEVSYDSSREAEITTGSHSASRTARKKGHIVRWLILAAVLAVVILKWDVISAPGHKLFQNSILNNLNTAAVIPDAALQYDGHFYYIYEGADSWADAENLCEKRGGHLVTITTQDENNLVYGLMTQEGCDEAYMGLYNRSYNAYQTWTWVTGEAIQMTGWGSGEPNNDNGGIEFYGEINNGGWNDCLLVSGDGYYICEWENDSPEAYDSSLLELNGHYYQIFSDASGWTDAKEKAEKKGGYLACITTAEEDAALLQLARRLGCNEAFFGLYQVSRTDSIYQFAWVDGENVGYTNWQEGQPDCCNGNEFYGQFGLGSGHWNDIDDDGTSTYIVEWDSQDAMK